ncbi:uncharacterized protein MYCFIDRAFT_201874 [Pseudocercospora fijiensis CIRAD86]|uniref:Uncharacterized protein n=1 Tax=Pseudocercospora fijiensis (strain CIRAD86) TaxID=383855 RepID=N1QB86_PSEFD|nr:uncharacterized protein MYCFIDRAFT_201874 [Pseudocercospora fijiensis CIRAD86]EME89306.1 hypothetical protein MYCFIDRAFT_201874 [Pseudocercospora fijiensis CIRAD86]
MAYYFLRTDQWTDACSVVDSWVEISSQPSSSSLSSIGDEIVTTGLRVQDHQGTRRQGALRTGVPSNLRLIRTPSVGANSSQEEYEESESESDRVMTSSTEGPIMAPRANRTTSTSRQQDDRTSDDDDENRTAINHPIRNDDCFTPLPNAFSHPPSGQPRHASQPVPGSYFPSTRPSLTNRPSTRHSMPASFEARRHSHIPQNPLSPSFNAAAEHDEALRASLSSLLSVAAAARGLPKSNVKQPTQTAPPRSNRIDPATFRLVPESALTTSSPPQLQEPTFKPTLRRLSTDSTSTTSEQFKEHKRKAVTAGRSSSRERRAMKKARRTTSSEDLHVTPTLLTWVVSAGVVVLFSALSFSAGYSVGKEAGRIEASTLAADDQLRSCAREAGRSSLGLKRSLARSAIQV